MRLLIDLLLIALVALAIYGAVDPHGATALLSASLDQLRSVFVE